MSWTGKCRRCNWKVRSEGSSFLGLSVRAHETATGHKVKVKHKEA